jgi:hypothetical protein
MLWFSCTTMPSRTRHSSLGNCCKSLVGKQCIFPHKVQIWHPSTVTFPTFNKHLSGHSFAHSEDYKCTTIIDATGTHILCVWYGQTCHTLYQVPQLSRGSQWKIQHHWHPHSVLSISFTKWILPVIYGYCKLSLWSTFIKFKSGLGTILQLTKLVLGLTTIRIYHLLQTDRYNSYLWLNIISVTHLHYFKTIIIPITNNI